MYKICLYLHSYLRWILLVLLVFQIFQTMGGWLGQKSWTDQHRKVSLVTLICTDLQLLLGFLLYAVSPVVTGALGNMKAAMKSPVLRFWAVEHLSMMLIAVVLIHIGYARAKRTEDDINKHKNTAIFYAIGLLVIFAAIPWPFRAAGRALFPF